MSTGSEKYQNVNFSLFRILIPVLIGAVKVSMTAPSGVDADTDRLWDTLTAQAYRDYVAEHVFAPANVVDARTASLAGDALAYRWPMPAGGWDSGDLGELPGRGRSTDPGRLQPDERGARGRQGSCRVGGGVPARHIAASPAEGWSPLPGGSMRRVRRYLGRTEPGPGA